MHAETVFGIVDGLGSGSLSMGGPAGESNSRERRSPAVGTEQLHARALVRRQAKARVGRRLGLAWPEGSVSMDLELEATRRESAKDDRKPENGVGLRFSLRW